MVYVSNLKSLNVMNGLKALKLYLSNESGYDNHVKYLKIPSSVDECVLTNIGFDEVVFEHGCNNNLKLQMDGRLVYNSITCKTNLSSDSYIKNTYSYEYLLPIDMKVSHSFLSKIQSSVYTANRNKISLYYPLNIDMSTYRPTLPFSMTFKVIFDYTNYNQTYLENGNLHATTWV